MKAIPDESPNFIAKKAILKRLEFEGYGREFFKKCLRLRLLFV